MNLCLSLCGGTTTNRCRRANVITFLQITRHSKKFGVFFFAFLNSTALGKKPPAERHKVFNQLNYIL